MTGGQREKRFPFDTPLKTSRHGRTRCAPSCESRLDGRAQRPRHARGRRKAYLTQVKHLASYKCRVCEVNAWTALYGRLRRVQITAEHVRKARATWIARRLHAEDDQQPLPDLAAPVSRAGRTRAPTPVDDVKPLSVPASAKVLVPATTFRTVAANLTDAKTRARFMVIASTGVRPAELKRAEPADVDLERRVWLVRTAKGGEPRAFWLNDDMLAAWQAFIAADAWGHFDGSDYAKALYAAGWPKDVRPYQARHSVALELGERGIDLGDVQGWLGHRHVTTTRKHYAPVLVSRLKQASERLAGRFEGWEPRVEPERLPVVVERRDH